MFCPAAPRARYGLDDVDEGQGKRARERFPAEICPGANDLTKEAGAAITKSLQIVEARKNWRTSGSLGGGR